MEEPALLDEKLVSVVAKLGQISKTGYIPNKPDKANQDIIFISQNFANIRNCWLFGVCDGHGLNGHFASDHIKRYLCPNIELLDFMAIQQKEAEKLKSPENRTKN